MGGFGLVFTIFAWKHAKSAKIAAEEARVATVQLTHEYNLNELLTDMVEFQQLVNVSFGGNHVTSGSLVSARANRLRGRVTELRQRDVESQHRDSILEKLDLAAVCLKAIADQAVKSTLDSTKRVRITASLGDVISALSGVIGLQRNEHRGT